MARMVEKFCQYRGVTFEIARGQHNAGRGKYCSRPCSHAARRQNKSLEQRRAEKAEYDRKRRNGPLRETILAKKRQHYEDNRPEFLAKFAERRKDPAYKAYMKEYGARYRSDPEWKAHKRQYDREYRARKMYGDFDVVYLVLRELEEELQNTGEGNASRQYERGRSNRCQLNRRAGAKEV